MARKELTDEQFLAISHKALKEFKGDIREIERAIGVLFVGRATGWKPLYLMHDRKSMKKYEDHLGIKFQEVLEDEGPSARRSIAYHLLLKAKEHLTNFWAVVRGETEEDIRSPQFRLK